MDITKPKKAYKHKTQKSNFVNNIKYKFDI